jgi:hypothetical protein
MEMIFLAVLALSVCAALARSTGTMPEILISATRDQGSHSLYPPKD